MRWETIVDDEVNPLPEMPESKVKHSHVAFVELLALWDDLMEAGREGGRRGRGSGRVKGKDRAVKIN